MLNKNKRASRAGNPLFVAIATALLCASAGIGAAPVANADHYLVLPRGTYDRLEAGRELVHDYGPFQLWRMDGSHALEIRSAAGKEAQPVDGAILFSAGAFDPSNGRHATLPNQGFQPQKPGPISIEIIQFAGPIAQEWYQQLESTGVTVLQYLPNNAYAVLASAGARDELGRYAAGNKDVRLADTMAPIYKLAGDLPVRARAGLSAQREIEVTVLLAKHAGNRTSKSAIQALDRAGTAGVWADSREFEYRRLKVRETDVEALAQLPDVFAIEPYVAPELMDEVQSQIIAGNTTVDGQGDVGPAGIGYRAWLTSQGFSTLPSNYPIVDVVDDGTGNGSIVNGAGDETLTLNGDGVTTRLQTIQNCTTDALGNGLAGHGHINTSIVGGYDDRGDAAGIQFPFEDLGGFLRGQGINPWARLAGTKIFTNAGTYNVTACGNTDPTVIKSSQDRGAAITSNSWGANTGGSYTASDRAYDIGTRDADLGEAGNQPLIHIFAAGNAGAGGANTVGSPGSAKNVITVGASENYRENDDDGAWTDGCTVGPTGADDAMDVIGFSSRGPTDFGRIKPEIIAPGTHIQGTASTSPGYDGTGVCDQFRPNNVAPNAQAVFAASSGTSHSTPAVSGVASLVYRYLQTAHSIAAPSAAMIKSYLMAHPTYLNGTGANDNLPSNTQGYGMPNLGRAFDATTSRVVLDQDRVLNATGDDQQYLFRIVDNTKPARISLAWSDAPGAINAAAQVNNLNLQVDRGAQSFRGNVFTGAFSSTGGTADLVNNYEAVFLPVGTTGDLLVSVLAANIAGDGVPNSGDAIDQDYALVCSNCAVVSTFAIQAENTTIQTCAAATANWNVNVSAFAGYVGTVNLSASSVPSPAVPSFVPASGAAPFASVFSLNTAGLASGNYLIGVNGTDGVDTRSDAVSLSHSAAAPGSIGLQLPANGITGAPLTPTLSWTADPNAQSYTVEIDNDSGFGSIDYTANTTSLSHSVATILSPSTQYFWRVRGISACGPGLNSVTRNFTTMAAMCVTPGTPIPDNNPAGINSVLVVPTGTSIGDLNVVFEATHTWIGDLIVTLTHNASPTTRTLLDRPGVPASGLGCTGDNPNIVFDDEAAIAAETSCTNTNPGYPVGSSRSPNQPLSGFDSLALAGNWTLNVSDRAGADTGTLVRWCLISSPAQVNAVDDSAFNATEDQLFTQAAPGVLANDVPSTGLSAVATTPPAGSLTFNADGSFQYQGQADFCGTDSFGYQASDGFSTDAAVVQLAVACVNDAPVASNDAYNGFEDTPVVVAQAQGVLINDTDVDANPLTAVSASDPPNGSVVLNTNGSFTYTPDANYCNAVTPDTFTYSANDGTINSTAPATVSVTVACVNDLPVAVADVGTVAEGGTLTVTAAAGVLANDTDAEGSALTAVLDVTTTNGALTLNANGSYSYVHNGGETTSDSFSYHANDGVADSNVVTVAITVTPVNDNAPVAVADTGTVAEGGTLNVAASGVLSNDTDVDGSALTAVLNTTTTNGLLTLNANGSYSYVHNGGETTSDSFTYHANDGIADSNVVTVAITVTAVNDAPTLSAPIGNQSSAEGAVINLNIAGNFADAEGQVLTFSTVSTLPAGLTLSAAGVISGTISFTAAGSYPGLVITASDGTGSVDSNAFSWTVSDVPQNQAPSFVNEPYTFTVLNTAAAGTAVGSILATDPDAGAALTYSITGGNTGNAFAINPATGEITVATPAALGPVNTVFTLNVSVSDGLGGTDAGSVQITVISADGRIFRSGFEG